MASHILDTSDISRYFSLSIVLSEFTAFTLFIVLSIIKKSLSLLLAPSTGRAPFMRLNKLGRFSFLSMANILFFAMESNIKRTAVLVSPLLQAICRAVSPW
jgi:hypothetical protein